MRRLSCSFWVVAAMLPFLAACAALPPSPPPRTLPDPVSMPVAVEPAGLVVEASVNGGAPAPFLLDTGLSDAHVLDRPAAVALGLSGRGVTLVGSWSGYSGASLTTVDSVSIGPVVMERPPVAVMALPDGMTDREQAPRFAGVVGQPLFHAYAVTIDAPAGRMTLSSGYTPPSDALILPIRMVNGLPAVEAAVAGVRVLLQIDTGDFGEVTLYEDAVRRLRLQDALGGGEERQAMAAGGRFAYRRHGASGLTLAGEEMGSVELHVAPRGTLFRSAEHGTIGLGLLRRFRFTVDQPGGRLVLERLGGTSPAGVH
ncbi:MAG TPA: pepsin/retropepsin-like aspartic protease family protein [Azospirillaceae bacterium]|nr:pepsin/retropepsin-like aspartic protease family protein [Azospirillaceae bacterium]